MTRYIDCFNGDADGICSLIQLRHFEPIPKDGQQILITGIKRDQKLLEKVDIQSNDVVTVLDVSADVNKSILLKTLKKGCKVLYVDHHFAGEMPNDELLECWIDEDSEINTAQLMNKRCKDQYWQWAVAGAFGDDMDKSARKLASFHNMSEEEVEECKRIGVCMNYNGYGPSIQDLHFPPDELYRLAQPFKTPREFIRGLPEVWKKLEEGYKQDMKQAKELKPFMTSSEAAVYILPDEKWARRVSGVYSNDLVEMYPNRAHAVLTPLPKKGQEETFVVSIRAPLNSRNDVNAPPAHGLAKQFPTGGGRAGAAGINVLPKGEVENFVETFIKYFSKGEKL